MSSQKITTVDEYIKEAEPPLRPLCERACDLLRDAAPGLREGIKWGAPNWSGNGNVCGLGAFSKHVDLFFFFGARLDDPRGLLEGSGKGMRHVKLFPGAEIDEDGICELIARAVALDAGSD